MMMKSKSSGKCDVLNTEGHNLERKAGEKSLAFANKNANSSIVKSVSSLDITRL